MQQSTKMSKGFIVTATNVNHWFQVYTSTLVDSTLLGNWNSIHWFSYFKRLLKYYGLVPSTIFKTFTHNLDTHAAKAVPTESKKREEMEPWSYVGKGVMENMHLLASDEADVEHTAISVNNAEKNTTWSLFAEARTNQRQYGMQDHPNPITRRVLHSTLHMMNLYSTVCAH